MVIFQNLSQKGEMLKNVGENIKKKFCTDLLLHPGYCNGMDLRAL